MTLRARAATLAVAATCLHGQAVLVREDGGALRVSAPTLRFLTGKPLERLHNGGSVVYAIQLSLFVENKTVIRHRSAGRFAVSYDLWEEKFAVTRLGNVRRTVSHLSSRAAEAWCLESLTLPVAGLSANTPFWVRLDVRAEAENESASDEQSPFSLTRLVDLFSRPPPNEEPRWREEAGPLRLAALKKP